MEDVTSHLAPAAAVQIGTVDVRRIEYRGQQVVTFAMIDKVHGRVDGTARRAFNENRDRFTEGEDCFEPTSDEIRTMSGEGVLPQRTARANLLTRRGYLKIVKSLNDDRAWEVFDDISEETGWPRIRLRRLAFERAAPIGAGQGQIVSRTLRAIKFWGLVQG